MDALENDNAEAEAADDDSEYEVEEGEGARPPMKPAELGWLGVAFDIVFELDLT